MRRELAWMAAAVLGLAAVAPWGRAQEGASASGSAGRAGSTRPRPASGPARAVSTTRPADPEVAAEEQAEMVEQFQEASLVMGEMV
jgi:hypothetical protein